MPSDLDTAIRNARRGIDERESPIRRQLRDAYGRAVDALTGDLELMVQRIGAARAAGEDVSPDWLRRETRYRRLLADAEREFARFTDDGLRILQRGQIASISGGAAEAWELMETAGIDVGFGGRVNTIAVENFVSALDPASPLRGVLDSYADNGATVIEKALTKGIIKGTGPREIARQLRRELKKGSTTARLDALVVTTMMDSFRGSLNEQYGRMRHLIQGYRRSCTKSIRTCLACLARDGHIQKDPHTDWHVNDRCIDTPVAIGSTFMPETGEEWLSGQTEKTRRSMFPSQASYDAFQAGDVTLNDFVGIKRSKVWGPSIRELSGSEAMRRAG